MRLSEGYSADLTKVWKLKKSLYGLKQAIKEWNCELTSHLIGYGFRQSPYDHYLFTMKTANTYLALLLYMDDLLIMES